MRQAIKNNLLSVRLMTHSRCHPLSQLNLKRHLLSWEMLPELQVVVVSINGAFVVSVVIFGGNVVAKTSGLQDDGCENEIFIC